MSALVISAVAFACVFAGALAGFAIRARLPEHHLSDDSKAVLQLGTGLIATLAALVLGLLTASAKTKFDTQSEEVQQTAANLVLLDRALARYGPETQPIRIELRSAVETVIANWNGGSPDPVIGGAPPPIETLQHAVIHGLSPTTDVQRAMQSRAQDLATSIATTRWLAFEQSGSSVSWPFLIVMVSWLSAVFVSCGLMSRPNATIVAVLLVCALSVSTAIFLILELDRPFRGLIHISSEPLALALQNLGK